MYTAINCDLPQLLAVTEMLKSTTLVYFVYVMEIIASTKL